jgi:heme-degrading monooxygenase HmoA
MPWVMISHKVADYGKWKRGVKAHAALRKASGEKSFYACRNSKEPNEVMVWCEWDTGARMKKFVGSAELREAMEKVGVVGTPKVSFFDKMDDLSV